MVDAKQAADLEKKLRANTFDFEDFLEQMRQMKKMGPLKDILGLLPGMGAQLKDVNIDDKQLARVEAIILSMTKEERRDPNLLIGSRRRRVAQGSGMTIQDVNRLISQFEQMRKMVRGMMGADGSAGRGMPQPGMARPGLGGGMMPRMPFGGGATGKHAGSNKKNKKQQQRRGFPFGK